MTSHTGKFKKMNFAVENVIITILMMPISHNRILILNLFATFLKDLLFDYTKLAEGSFIYFI